MEFNVYDIVTKEALEGSKRITETFLNMREEICRLPEGENRRQKELLFSRMLFFLMNRNLYNNDAECIRDWEIIEEKYYKDIKHKFVKEE